MGVLSKIYSWFNNRGEIFKFVIVGTLFSIYFATALNMGLIQRITKGNVGVILGITMILIAILN